MRRNFNDLEWIFELMYDGFRALAVVEYGSFTLFSRNGHAFRSFPAVLFDVFESLVVYSRSSAIGSAAFVGMGQNIPDQSRVP